jgi:multidrug efflux pump
MTFFIHRPVFAWVIAIIVMLTGYFALTNLPVSQYPNVAPPAVNISATYPGADAQTLENSVTQIIEQSLTGIDGLMYFESKSSSNGTVSITATFEQSVDPDTAQVQVQNKVQQVISRLPTEVQRQGLAVNKSQSDFLIIVSMYDETGKMTNADISNYISTHIKDPLSRLSGVGSIRVFGSEFAMRVWMNPQKLAQFKLMPQDIADAINTQNVELSSGKIGASPMVEGHAFTATVKSQSKLRTVEEFDQILLTTTEDGQQVYLKDVARVEIGQESYGAQASMNGHPAAGLAVMLAPGANALDTAESVKAMLTQFKANLPEGTAFAFPLDNTDYIKLSINEVLKTLAEAIVLVVLVMWLFLQNWRATLIPAITIPVVLLGTFGMMAVMGYSINTLTLFALVLAIGLLVDDSIVVVENVDRLMYEKNLSPKEATIESMKEISSALVGIAAVLSAVFIPMAFFDGSSGVIYRQFSVTMVTAMVLSVFVAIILTPAICATFLKPAHHKTKGFFGAFNRFYSSLQTRYGKRTASFVTKPLRFMVIYFAIGGGLFYIFNNLPTSFIPQEDQGKVFVMYNLRAGATIERTQAVGDKILEYFNTHEKDNVEIIFNVSGFNFSGQAENAGIVFAALKDWSQRPGEENSAQSIANRAMNALSQIRDASVFALSPPPIQGLGQSDGFQLFVQGRGDRATLDAYKHELMAQLRQNEKIVGVRLNELGAVPRLDVLFDNQKMQAQSVNVSDAQSVLSMAWGGRYINDMILQDRIKKVYLQADAPFRADADDIGLWHVRAQDGSMTPLDTFTDAKWTISTDSLNRYNGLPAYSIQGSAAPGVSSGDAMAEIERILAKAPADITYSWSGLSLQEKISQGKSTFLYAVSILMIFLCLAALYESWSIPMSVMLVIPLGVIGAALAIYFRGLDNNIYFQVALLTIIGLSSKNAILIIEFAELYFKEGRSVIESATQAAIDRLRPILMTSIAFVVGVIPLALSSGAGANSRISIGTAVVGGTITATVLAIFFVPVFFVIVKSLVLKAQGRKA